MLQTVSSLEPLEEVSYYPRGDGLADIRIRRNITTVMHGDGETAWTEYTADEAYKKGVEMTMNQLKEILSKLGITEIPALGQPFDPNLHNAVMHVEDESLGENVVAAVFQAGFQCGEKVIRFAMVQVAN